MDDTQDGELVETVEGEPLLTRAQPRRAVSERGLHALARQEPEKTLWDEFTLLAGDEGSEVDFALAAQSEVVTDARKLSPGLSPDEIREVREQARMSQAAFARRLNLTAGYISQLERGVRRPRGATLVLLRIVQRNGIDILP